MIRSMHLSAAHHIRQSQATSGKKKRISPRFPYGLFHNQYSPALDREECNDCHITMQVIASVCI
uniref:Uncharacterized protein n=1 Tax=Picea glauca TaxID=3330 RepID=A0A117NHS8_PICGL|nr:hypothetical protein ABT39_MTgene4197 [Picea glauca]